MQVPQGKSRGWEGEQGCWYWAIFSRTPVCSCQPRGYLALVTGIYWREGIGNSTVGEASQASPDFHPTSQNFTPPPTGPPSCARPPTPPWWWVELSRKTTPR